MSYRKIPEIPRAERTYWSPERGGRLYQMVGGKRVRKFSYSPYTAKAYREYTFYADVEMEKEIESPPESGKMKKTMTFIASVGTFIEFKREVILSETGHRLVELVASVGGGDVISVTYWRNRGEKRGEVEA